MIKKRVPIKGATLVFYTYEIDQIRYLEFDSSKSDCPEPMINAMRALQSINDPNERVVMINAQEPRGLYSRVESDFEWSVESIEDDLVKITFKKKSDTQNSTNFDNVSCSG